MSPVEEIMPQNRSYGDMINEISAIHFINGHIVAISYEMKWLWPIHIVYNFGLSECNRVKSVKWPVKVLDPLYTSAKH